MSTVTLWNTPEHLASRLARGHSPALHSERQVLSATRALTRLLDRAERAEPLPLPATVDGSDFLIGLAILVGHLRRVLAESEWLTYVHQLPPVLRSVAARAGAEANPGLAVFWDTVLRDGKSKLLPESLRGVLSAVVATPELSLGARREVQSAISATAELHSSIADFLADWMAAGG